MSPSHGYLALAIICEVIATSSLKHTEEFSRLWPSLMVLAGYSASFWLLTLALRDIPVGVAYAIWSGCGIVLVAAAGMAFYNQRLDVAGAVGMGLIVLGVIVLNVFSNIELH